MKESKDDVDYSPGMVTRRCGRCKYYRAGSCALVAGKIDPRYWCRLFKKKGA